MPACSTGAGRCSWPRWAWPSCPALVLILLPARLLAGRAGRRLRRATAAYFLLIGLGFLLVEIAVLQRLVLLLGHPVHAFAVTLAAFLVCAGIGSGMAAQAGAGRGPARADRWLGRLELVLLLIAALATLHALAGPWLLARGLELAALPRAALAVALVAPLAFAMGLPFPLALARAAGGRAGAGAVGLGRERLRLGGRRGARGPARHELRQRAASCSWARSPTRSRRGCSGASRRGGPASGASGS